MFLTKAVCIDYPKLFFSILVANEDDKCQLRKLQNNNVFEKIA
ncbi:hypothetical protein SAMN02745724_05293 [Pseudoalteromonas denitrificans DSM 6059]|uniref:Uncharacterized protein n=1 Tax=Pseudoalteromonas denitrificans DSM 6059 TaxID=1123010 RepID=A0A1I1UNV8_9GAMM|nr:hypothetical protein SAMN02745724_05293 [Pseudoalteromonas denitrificans DSM 6059]